VENVNPSNKLGDTITERESREMYALDARNYKRHKVKDKLNIPQRGVRRFKIILLSSTRGVLYVAIDPYYVRRTAARLRDNYIRRAR